MDNGSCVECGGNDAALAGYSPSRASGAAPSTGRAEEGELPEGWRSTPFTETLCPEKPRVTKVQQSNYRKSGRFPIIDQGQTFIAGYWDSENDVFREHLPVIVFGDHTRVFKFVDFPFVAGADGTHVLVPDTRRFDPFFLYLALSSLDIASRGYNRHFRLLRDRSVVTPSLPEQRAIAGVLRTVQGAKEACEQVLAAARQLKQSLLHHLITYGPVPSADAAHVPLRETEIGEIPQHWGCAALGDVLTLVYRYPTYYNIQYVADGVPEIRGELLHENGEIEPNMGVFRFISQETANRFPRTCMDEGDIVMSVRGTMGKIGIVPTQLAGAQMTANLIRLAPDREKIHPDFLRRALLSPRFLHRLNELSPQTTIKTIQAPVLRTIPIPLPPLPEQREIAAQLAAVDAKLAALEARRAALAALFQSLLHHLITGKVRLPEFAKDHS